jgi:hypothetical protein
MKFDAAMESVEETAGATPDKLGHSPDDSLDGDVPIEGDGGTSDNSGQTHVPPPPPPLI